MLKEPSDIIRPQPLIDFQCVDSEIFEEEIRPVSVEETLEVVRKGKKMKSCHAHGLPSYLFNFISDSYSSMLVKVFNYSFTTAYLPAAWKEAQIDLENY